MASVKSVTIHDDYARGNQRERRYKVTITNNSLIDAEYILSPVVVDVADDGAAQGNKKLASLADIETGSGADIVAEYQSQADYDRRALGKAMIGTDIDEFHQVLPLYLAMTARGGNNAGQRAAYLGVPTAQYNSMAVRFNDDQGAASFIDDAKGQVWDEIPADWE